MSPQEAANMSAAGPPQGAKAPMGGSAAREAASVGATFGKVAVLMGGASAEREVSLMSGGGVLKALLSKGVDAHAFDPAERALDDLKREGFARCFIALHGRFGEDGTVQGALELLGIPSTGSGVMASAISMDKVMTKRIWRFEGLPTPAWAQVSSAAQTHAAFAELGAPMIVKPAREGSSIGFTKVLTVDQCDAAYALAAQHDVEVLCEQFIAGDEVTCPVLGPADAPQALPLIRIVAPDGNYDYQNKYFTDVTQYLVPAGLPAGEEEAISAMVCRAYQVLRCRGWARADVMIDATTRKPYLLEINTSPGMTGHSLVPMSAKAAGLSYEDLCVQLLRSATLDAKAGA
jgi:D-alanine-D-alanine ligase